MNINRLFILLILFCSTPIFASSVTGKIQFLLPHAGDHVFFNMVGYNNTQINSQGTNSSCITTNGGNFRVDLSNETGAAIYAALLTARAQNSDIKIVGTNTCTHSRENVLYVLL